jgi:hypothetical protein
VQATTTQGVRWRSCATIGTSWPRPPRSAGSRWNRWLADFEALEIKPDVRPKILKHNAARLLGLEGS